MPATTTRIMGCDVICTCEACPEQYDVFRNGTQIGYLRLRWGWFSAYCPRCFRKTVYETQVGDSEYAGDFGDDDERERHLRAAVRALLKEELAQTLGSEGAE